MKFHFPTNTPTRKHAYFTYFHIQPHLTVFLLQENYNFYCLFFICAQNICLIFSASSLILNFTFSYNDEESLNTVHPDREDNLNDSLSKKAKLEESLKLIETKLKKAKNDDIETKKNQEKKSDKYTKQKYKRYLLLLLTIQIY